MEESFIVLVKNKDGRFEQRELCGVAILTNKENAETVIKEVILEGNTPDNIKVFQAVPVDFNVGVKATIKS